MRWALVKLVAATDSPLCWSHFTAVSAGTAWGLSGHYQSTLKSALLATALFAFAAAISVIKHRKLREIATTTQAA